MSDQLIERIITEACFVAETPPQEGNSDALAGGEIDHDMEQEADALHEGNEDDSSAYLLRLKDRYVSDGRTEDWSIPVNPLLADSKGLGPGTLIIPGWIRERAAEVLFGDLLDEEVLSVPDAILQCVQAVSRSATMPWCQQLTLVAPR